MKTNYLLLSFIFLSFFTASAQEEDTTDLPPREIAVDLLATHSPILNRNFFGFSADMKYYVQQKWGTGFNFAVSSKKVSSNYTYDVGEPDVVFVSVGWLNQFDIIQEESVRVGINLNNGVAIVNLRDRSETETVWDEYGSSEVPISKATNVFYIIEPGITMSFRLIKSKTIPDVFLTSQAKYRKAFGSADFAKTSDFSNYFIGVGISFIGMFD